MKTTIGLYANGDYVVNVVNDCDLESHIKYNIENRPGRALFVEGKCVNKGYHTDEEIKLFVKRIKNENIKASKITKPYN